MNNFKTRNKEKLYALSYIVMIIFFLYLGSIENPKFIMFTKLILPFYCIYAIYVGTNAFMKSKSLISKIGNLTLMLVFVILFINSIPGFLNIIKTIPY